MAERVTLTAAYEHEAGRVLSAGDHVLPDDIAAGARAAGVVAPPKPARVRPPSAKPKAKAARKPAAKR